MINICHRNVFIRHAKLNVVGREQLVVTHIIFLHPHKGSGFVRLGIAVSAIPAGVQFLNIFAQLVFIFLKALKMTLLRRLMMASPVNKVVFIDILYFGISVYYLIQIVRNIFRVCFDFDSKASQLVVDFVQ